MTSLGFGHNSFNVSAQTGARVGERATYQREQLALAAEAPPKPSPVFGAAPAEVKPAAGAATNPGEATGASTLPNNNNAASAVELSDDLFIVLMRSLLDVVAAMAKEPKATTETKESTESFNQKAPSQAVSAPSLGLTNIEGVKAAAIKDSGLVGKAGLSCDTLT